MDDAKLKHCKHSRKDRAIIQRDYGPDSYPTLVLIVDTNIVIHDLRWCMLRIRLLGRLWVGDKTPSSRLMSTLIKHWVLSTSQDQAQVGHCLHWVCSSVSANPHCGYNSNWYKSHCTCVIWVCARVCMSAIHPATKTPL